MPPLPAQAVATFVWEREQDCLFPCQPAVTLELTKLEILAFESKYADKDLCLFATPFGTQHFFSVVVCAVL